MNNYRKPQKTSHFIIILGIMMAISISACHFPTPVASPTVSIPANQVSPTPAIPDGVELPEDSGDAPVEFTPAALQATPQSPGASATPAVVSDEKGYCGRTEASTILVLGIDDHAQADAIRLLRVDFQNATVHMTSIPRDFYVPIVGFEPYGINYGRINATFGYGEYFLGNGTGASSLGNNITYNFGVNVDHQMVIYLDEIAKYIDAIGGITVTLEEPAQDLKYYFAAGTHEMDGETAVKFMRIRELDTDIQRIERQTIVLGAILDKVRSGISPKMVYEVLSALVSDETTQTDMGLIDMYSYYCLSKIIDRKNNYLNPITDNFFHPYTSETGAQVLIPHAEVVDFIQQSLGLFE